MAEAKTGTVAKLLREWWGHRGSLGISFAVMIFALCVYFATFVGERPMPTFDSIDRLELNTLDARFQFRGRVTPDPRIVIVDIDQHSQEQLGRWPFPRINFAHALDALREDGAKVVVSISPSAKRMKPPAAAGAFRGPRFRQKRAAGLNPTVQLAIAEKEKQYNYDQQLADSITRFGHVVLGNYFLYTKTDLAGVSNEALDKYAALISFFPYTQVRPSRPAPRRENRDQERLKVIQIYENQYLVPRGAEANADSLRRAIAAEKGGAGFFNVAVDADTVVRRIFLAIPYGRDEDRKNWDIYPSLDVQTVRQYLDLSSDQPVLIYGDAGIASLEFGPKLRGPSRRFEPPSGEFPRAITDLSLRFVRRRGPE